MCFSGGGPSPPPPPPPLPPDPVEQERLRKLREEEKQRKLRAQGRSSTILNDGDEVDLSGPAGEQQKTLLGGPS